MLLSVTLDNVRPGVTSVQYSFTAASQEEDKTVFIVKDGRRAVQDCIKSFPDSGGTEGVLPYRRRRPTPVRCWMKYFRS
ncbi:hypothetical protein E2C01_017064 [Portunus trituberculatus]|uniref:Uncharacterized protein n=1 Tax=Portunus trituberculatus TaxID=210409 RepID=A0A5B7DSD4_PORTR|nr:hypothetical protein [Portunus trituberculatus]